jgi:diketogulonate reductase-like aldo/keto reductase
MEEDLAIFSDVLADDEKSQLDSATKPAGNPSWACSSMVGAAANIPNVTFNNGIQMPMISLGTWQYDDDTAEAAVRLALQTGFNHIDTANNYRNQAGVGKALADFDRSTYFLTTKVPSTRSSSSAYDTTTKALEEDLSLLGLDYVDLMLIHSPASSCKTTQEQWRALEDFYAAGKAKAIGVSNYCLSSFACINETAKVQPVLNQIEFHVGMGVDPKGLKSYHDAQGIVTQAYSPLGDGDSELITGDLVTGIGQAHSWSGAQTSMRWLIENNVPLTTKTTKQSHMEEDLAIFSDVLADDEKSQLDSATKPAGNPSWACSSVEELVV